MPDPAYRYTYSATAVRVIDGDTVTFDVSLGFGMWLRAQSFRLVGINAIEINQPGGKDARANLVDILTAGPNVTMTSIKPDKYGGRYLADVSLADGTHLASLLVSTGWAAPWDGRGVRPVPPWPREVP